MTDSILKQLSITPLVAVSIKKLDDLSWALSTKYYDSKWFKVPKRWHLKLLVSPV